MIGTSTSASVSCRLGNAPTPIMNGVSKLVPRKIINIDLAETTSLPKDGVFTCSTFTVSETNFYNICFQVALVCTNDTPVQVDYLQFGVCKENLEDCQCMSFQSSIINNTIASQYVIAQNQSSIMNLEKDKTYQCWVNVCCPTAEGKDNSVLQFNKSMSHLRLYKL